MPPIVATEARWLIVLQRCYGITNARTLSSTGVPPGIAEHQLGTARQQPWHHQHANGTCCCARSYPTYASTFLELNTSHFGSLDEKALHPRTSKCTILPYL
jgi:hypothetical protein